MANCKQLDNVRDYAFEELDKAARAAVERHLPQCGECQAELDRLRLTTAALRVLPDVEIPQRIAFVSDKVFEPAPWRQWLSSARMGFASALVMAVALVAVALRPAPSAPAVVERVVSGVSSEEVARLVDAAVKKVREEDLQLTRAAMEAAEVRHAAEHKALMTAVEDNLTVLERRYNTLTSLSAGGGGQ